MKHSHILCTGIFLVFAVLSSIPITGYSVEIEPNARIDDQISNKQGVANDLARLIRARGWTCDSIYSIIMWNFSIGFTVYCNGARYSYEVEDKGGNWEVTLD